MKVKFEEILNDLYEDVDSAVVDDFSKISSMCDNKGFIDTDDAGFQLFLRDFLEEYEDDYQIDLIKNVLDQYYDTDYDLYDELDDTDIE